MKWYKLVRSYTKLFCVGIIGAVYVFNCCRILIFFKLDFKS